MPWKHHDIVVSMFKNAAMRIAANFIEGQRETSDYLAVFSRAQENWTEEDEMGLHEAVDAGDREASNTLFRAAATRRLLFVHCDEEAEAAKAELMAMLESSAIEAKAIRERIHEKREAIEEAMGELVATLAGSGIKDIEVN